MKISIFSKFDMCGGSEFRCVELANGIADFTKHTPYLLAEKKLPERLKMFINPKVNVVENCFLFPSYFYDTDYMVVIGTDAKEFSTLDYWQGKSSRHNFSIDMDLMKGKTVCFLYNFIVSPSRNLLPLQEKGINVKIITTNMKFFNEISKQDRYESIRILPRYTLESPIDPNKLDIKVRTPKDKMCFGMHSKTLGNKWNDEIPKLVKELQGRYEDRISFRFMGVKSGLKEKLKMSNVEVMAENAESVKEFLNKLDVFLFFPDWKREEPWARVVAEAMVSGCPVIALNKGGTPDQVLKDNSGILCKKYNDYFKAVVYMMEHPDMVEKMSRNSLRISKSFYVEAVIGKLMKILEV